VSAQDPGTSWILSDESARCHAMNWTQIAGFVLACAVVSGLLSGVAWCCWRGLEPERAWACLWRSLFRVGRGQLPVPVRMYASSREQGRRRDRHGTGGSFRPLTTGDIWRRVGDRRAALMPADAGGAGLWLFGQVGSTMKPGHIYGSIARHR